MVAMVSELGLPSSDRPVGQTSVSLVDTGGHRPLWSSSNESFSIEHPLYRRFHDRLGSLSLRTAGFRSVEPGGEISAHLCSRDESRSARSFGFLTSVEGSGDLSCNRQFHGGCLYQQSRGHKVSDTVLSVSGASSNLSEEQHSPFSETCSRQTHVGRHPLPGSQACVDRVDSLPSSVLSGLGSSPRRSVFNLF